MSFFLCKRFLGQGNIHDNHWFPAAVSKTVSPLRFFPCSGYEFCGFETPPDNGGFTEKLNGNIIFKPAFGSVKNHNASNEP